MKQTFYFIFISLIIVSCKNEKSISSIVKDFEHKTFNVNSWKYDILYKMKFFKSEKDTFNYFVNCRLIRHEADTIFGGSFWIKNDSIDRYYDLENIYIINHKKKQIKRYFPKKGQDWAINGNVVGGVLKTYFFGPNKLSKYLEDSTNIITLYDTVFKSKNKNAVEVRFADKLPIEQRKKTFLFNQKNKLKSITYSVKFQNNWQYNEWNLSNSKYNTVTDKELKSELKELMKTYEIEDYVDPDPKEVEPLAIGQKAPEFTGYNFHRKDSINLNEFKNKYVLVDFWYKDCPPCIKAIKLLNKVRAKYPKDKLVILGLNPYDGKKEDKNKLIDFFKINEMSYPTVFVETKVTKDYKVSAYPTFYIIDKNGDIVYSGIGYAEDKNKTIDSLLNTWVK